MGNPNDSLTGIIVSIYNLGCFAGCLVNFVTGDMLGRRRSMWFAMSWIIVSWSALLWKIYLTRGSDRCYFAVFGVYSPAHDGWSIRDGNRNWYRNVNGAHVPGRVIGRQ